MTKFERCVEKVRTQKRTPGKKFWSAAAVSICKKSCKKCRGKK